jgi:predicted methyltransferase
MINLRRRAVIASMAALPLAIATRAAAAKPDPRLAAAVASDLRKPADKARDAWRHPLESLNFWGLKPGMTVLDVGGASGWWTDIIAPYLAATGGRYICTGPDLASPNATDNGRRIVADFRARYADKARFGDVTMVGFGKNSGPLAPAGSVDFVLVAREIHNWPIDGVVDKDFADLTAVLKRGGVMAVEDHRAPEGADPMKDNGYISEGWVIEHAKAAGLKLAARSQINANPKDTKDHPFGVWTLPPSLRSSPFGKPEDPAFDHSKYAAIGESDRMTLRLVKV